MENDSHTMNHLVIILLTLIVTSVVTTVSTNVILLSKERHAIEERK